MTIQRSPGSFPDLSPKCGVCFRPMKFAPNLRDSNASRSKEMPRTATRTRMRSSVRPRPWRPSASGSSPRSKTSSPRIRSARLERALVSRSQVVRAPLTSRNVIVIAPQLATDAMRGARRAGPQPIIEFRPASPARNISNGDRDGLLLADENHELLATGDAGIEEIPLQHWVVLRHDRDDHGGILRTLALVDGGGIGGDQRVEFAEAVGHRAPIEARRELARLGIDVDDVADIAVVDLLVVVILDLHELVAWGKGPGETFDLAISGGGLKPPAVRC